MFKYTMPILIECWPQYWISSRGLWNYIRRGREGVKRSGERERGMGWRGVEREEREGRPGGEEKVGRERREEEEGGGE
jgi:hypothetical protein